MQREFANKGKTLGGSSDLTLLAKIKAGFVPALESVTYKTRVKKVLEALHNTRQTAHEYALARLLTDAVERVGVILSVRVAVFEPEDEILLSVTFDGPWQAYIRNLWLNVGTLLDLIFCNSEGYVLAFENSFEEWLAWANSVQRESGFFYGPPEFTARDALYQRRIESMRSRGLADALNELRAVLPSAEMMVQRTLQTSPATDAADEPAVCYGDGEAARPRMVIQRMQTGLRGLLAMHRLAEMYPPLLPSGTRLPDGEIMRRAAFELLAEFVSLRGNPPWDEWMKYEKGTKTPRFVRALRWLNAGAPPTRNNVPANPRDSTVKLIAEPGKYGGDDIQGGILRPYANVTHGLAALVAFPDQKNASIFFSSIAVTIAKHSDTHDLATDAVVLNVAVTPAGMRTAGLTEDEMALFPLEFLQGMAARAGLLGDVRHNHPRRWALPDRAGKAGQVVDMAAVHALLVWRCRSDSPVFDWSDQHPLRNTFSQFQAGCPTVTVLSIQPLAERQNDHFGYRHGQGQPQFSDDPVMPKFTRNTIHYGEIVQGFDNASDRYADKKGPALLWLKHGSFLVARKYRLHPERLQASVEKAAGDMARQFSHEEAKDLIYAKMMGRKQTGEFLAPPPLSGPAPGPASNNFTFDRDVDGRICPLHAHIRLANPRTTLEEGRRFPRITRRGMSTAVKWGDPNQAPSEPGTLFLAYNADISEQFEVIQKWLVGGNSTSSSSGKSCPILGVPENGEVRQFQFEYPGKAIPAGDLPEAGNFPIEEPAPLFSPPNAITQLEWGMYLFAPSVSILCKLANINLPSNSRTPAWTPQEGVTQLEDLEKRTLALGKAGEVEAIQMWKAALEDPDAVDSYRAAALWAAIRDQRCGFLDTPYGSLVVSQSLIHQVLDDETGYSVRGQAARMRPIIGDIALGMDAGSDYNRESPPINDAIMALTDSEGKKYSIYELAFNAASGKLTKIIDAALDNPLADERLFDTSFEVREIVEEVLADLGEHWFGLKEAAAFLERGGSDLTWHDGQKPLYPGHFTALSRYFFQPQPNDDVVKPLAESYGAALRSALKSFVDSVNAGQTATTVRLPVGLDGQTAILFEAIYKHTSKPTDGTASDFVARNVLGVLMGFTPTIIGAVVNVMREWQRDGVFAQMQAQLAGQTDRGAAHRVLLGQMVAAAQNRPMPQIAWRLPKDARKPLKCPHSGADIAFSPNQDKPVVLAFVSGTHENWGQGGEDLMLMFGGTRKGAATHPTHACPGYEAAIEAMLGCLSAMVSLTHIDPASAKPYQHEETDGSWSATATSLSLRAAPGWLNFQITGKREILRAGESNKLAKDTPTDEASSGFLAPVFDKLIKGALAFAKTAAKAKEAAFELINDKKVPQTPLELADIERLARDNARSATAFALGQIASGRKAFQQNQLRSLGIDLPKRTGLILAWGDSWLDYAYHTEGQIPGPDSIRLGIDIRDWLEKMEYAITKDDFCSWTKWKTSSVMAGNTAPFCNLLRDSIETGNAPKAILLSSGGNDIVGTPLQNVLNGVGGTEYFKKDAADIYEVDKLMSGIETNYQTILREIQAVLNEENASSVPILIHSYAVPFPDLKSNPLYWFEAKKWLWDPFVNNQYVLEGIPSDIARARQVAIALLGKFEAMQVRLVAQFNVNNYRVIRVNSASVLPKLADATYRDIWRDPMHLKDEYFAKIALAIDGIVSPP